MDLNEIQKHLDEMMRERNQRSVPEFEGYSPAEMHQLIHFTFQSNSPLSLKKLSKDDHAAVPMLNQMKYFLTLIREKGPLKLTAKGYLSPKIVEDVYKRGHLKEPLYERGLSKRFWESDCTTVQLTRLLADIAGLIKEENGLLSLTKKGEELIAQDQKLLELIFRTHLREFNWAYFDHYDNDEIGQMGAGFTLILLKKYGQNKRKDSFYAQKYLKAFPQLLDLVPDMTWISREDSAGSCYSYRTFNRFLDYYGLIKIQKKADVFVAEEIIRKTPLYDKFIKVDAPKRAK